MEALGEHYDNRFEEDEDGENVRVLEVWYTLRRSVDVYLRCQSEILAGMGGAVHLTVTCREVDSACRLMLVPRNEWPTVLDDVQYMSSVSARLRNEDNKSRPVPKTQR